MKAKLEQVVILLDKAADKIDLGMPFTSQIDVKEAQRLVKEVLAEEFPAKYSRDTW